MRKLFISLTVVISLIIGLITLWFWPNIQGHYRFKQYCAREGGLRVNGTVLPDQGWLAAGTDPHDYKAPFYLGKVAFVRYQDKDGARFDVYAKPNPWPNEPDYILQPVDESKTVMYVLKQQFIRYLPNELRLGQYRDEVFSIKENRTLASITNFQYEQFERDKTFLAAPSFEVCEGVANFDKFPEMIFPIRSK
jgi:hypothetical protein